MARILDTAASHARAIRMSTYGSSSTLEIELMKMHREDAVLARLENQIRYPVSRGSVLEGGVRGVLEMTTPALP